MIRLLILCCVLYEISGLAKWMTKEECKKQLRVGEYIMGSPAKFSDKRVLKVFRNDGDIPLNNGDAYIPGEQLLVMLYGPKDNGLQYVLEVNNAKFSSGGCDGKRIANVKLGKLNVPTDATEDITIVSGWALGYDNVKITPTFRLIPSKDHLKNDPITVLADLEDQNTKNKATNGTLPATIVQDFKNSEMPSSPPPSVSTIPSVSAGLSSKQNLRTGTNIDKGVQQDKSIAPPSTNTPATAPPPAATTLVTATSTEKPLAAVAATPLDKTITTATTTSLPDAVQSGSIPVAEKIPLTTQTTSIPNKYSKRKKDNLLDLDLTELEDIDQEENLDIAIEKMQQTLNKMKQKQLLKKSTEFSSEEHSNYDKRSDTKPIKLKLTRHRNSNTTTTTLKNNKQSDLGLNAAEMSEMEEDSTEEEGENELETASQVRLRHNTQKKQKRVILTRSPTGKLLTPEDIRRAEEYARAHPRTVQSSIQILLTMIICGCIGLMVISLTVTGVVYCVNHGDIVRGYLGRLFRRKQGQDKE